MAFVENSNFRHYMRYNIGSSKLQLMHCVSTIESCLGASWKSYRFISRKSIFFLELNEF